VAGSRTREFIAAAAAACLVALGRPTPAAAEATVSVEFVYGSVAVGGMGIFIAFAGSWEALAGGEVVPDALVEVAGKRMRFGMPLAPLLPFSPEDPADRPAFDGVLLNLVRWRF
jgi:hypothetical protein